MENMASKEQEKASAFITEKTNNIAKQLEEVYPALVEAIDRLGGCSPSGEQNDKMGADISLPFVDGDSFLLDLHRKVVRIKELANQYEQQISRLNNLI